MTASESFRLEYETIFSFSKNIESAKYIGNTCLFKQNKFRIYKLEFTDSRSIDVYGQLTITLINPNVGILDKISINFADLWGHITDATSNKTFKPCMNYSRCDNTVWWTHKPDYTCYKSLAAAIDDFIDSYSE